MENALKRGLPLLLLLAATAAFASYQSPASTPSNHALQLPSFQSQAPEQQPEVLLIYDEQGTLDTIELRPDGTPAVYTYEAVMCLGEPARSEGGWSQNGVTFPEGNKPQDGATAVFAGWAGIGFRGHNRYYDPELGRFTQPDPMGYADSMNLYQAFNQSPQNFGDPMGLKKWFNAEVSEQTDFFVSVNFETGIDAIDYPLGLVNTTANLLGGAVNQALYWPNWGMEKGDEFLQAHGGRPGEFQDMMLFIPAFQGAEIAHGLRSAGVAMEYAAAYLNTLGRYRNAANRVAQVARPLGADANAEIRTSQEVVTNSGIPARPSWQAAEADTTADLVEFGFKKQPSYLQGKPVKYGTPGSVRPDAASEHMLLSVDAKRYNLVTPQGRYKMVKDVLQQAVARTANLPQGMRQGLVIDIRGLQVNETLLNKMIERIVARSNGAIVPENIIVRR